MARVVRDERDRLARLLDRRVGGSVSHVAPRRGSKGRGRSGRVARAPRGIAAAPRRGRAGDEMRVARGDVTRRQTARRRAPARVRGLVERFDVAGATPRSRLGWIADDADVRLYGSLPRHAITGAPRVGGSRTRALRRLVRDVSALGWTPR